MYRDDSARTRRNCRFDPRRIDVVGVPRDIDEDWASADVFGGVSGRHPGEGWNDDLVTGADIERHHREMKRGGAGGRRERKPCLVALRHEPFEALGQRPLRHPTGIQAIAQQRDLRLVKGGCGQAQMGLPGKIPSTEQHIDFFTITGVQPSGPVINSI